MKRLQFAAVPTQTLSPGSAQISAGRICTSGGEGLEHSLFVPLHYEKNYAYPLVVWLHSHGDNHRQLKRIIPVVSLRNYVAIAPRGTAEIDERTSRWEQTEGDILEAQWRVTQCIELAQQRCNVHTERMFIGGHADGGTMALRLALRMPHLFAGAFSIGGPLPQEHAPLINVQNARQLPLLLMQGSDSARYPTDHLCRDISLLHTAGMGAAVRQYPCGDDLTTQMLADANSWLMERVTGARSAADDAVVPDLGEWN